MIKRLLILCLLILANPVYANWYEDIFSAITMISAQGGMTNNVLGAMNAQGGQMLSTEQDIDALMKELNKHVIGHSGWGTYKIHDYQSYSDNVQDWQGLMALAESGHRTGELGRAAEGISSEFPLENKAFNKGVAEPRSQKYYALKSQSILAVRAASQVEFNKIQEQINYQKMLQQQIERTKDLKAAIDLSNRINVEGNLINLEILRQTALANQQQAITEQGNVNSALSNARFLTK